jgi:hypothetical protein
MQFIQWLIAITGDAAILFPPGGNCFSADRE